MIRIHRAVVSKRHIIIVGEVVADLHLDRLFPGESSHSAVRLKSYQKMSLPSQKNNLWKETLQNPKVQDASMLFKVFSKLSPLHVGSIAPASTASGCSRFPDLPDISALSVSSAAVPRCRSPWGSRSEELHSAFDVACFAECISCSCTVETHGFQLPDSCAETVSEDLPTSSTHNQTQPKVKLLRKHTTKLELD